MIIHYFRAINALTKAVLGFHDEETEDKKLAIKLAYISLGEIVKALSGGDADSAIRRSA